MRTWDSVSSIKRFNPRPKNHGSGEQMFGWFVSPGKICAGWLLKVCSVETVLIQLRLFM
jgi:hypothetical protein